MVGTNVDEGRFQQLIPARYLPSARAVITGMSVISVPGPPQLTYASLRITLSHIQATSLSPTFANNLPNPVVVLSGTDRTLSFAPRDWSPPISFDQPFLYDGQNDLVFDIQKVLDHARHPPAGNVMSSAVSGNPGRTDLPFPRYEFGPLGSGASTASVGTRASSNALKVQLHLVPVDSIAVGSDRGGVNNNVFAIGATFWERLRATPGTPFAHFIWFAFNSSPVNVPPVHGSAWLPIQQAVVWFAGTVGPTGVDRQTAPIPGNPGIVGARVTFQSVVVDTASNAISWTNAADFRINP